MLLVFLLLMSLLIGAALPYIFSNIGIRRWKKKIELLLEQARLERQKLELETLTRLQEKQQLFENEKSALNKEKIKLKDKESLLKAREESIESLSSRLEEKRKRADARNKELDALEIRYTQKLHELAHISQKEALLLVQEMAKKELQSSFETVKQKYIQDLIEAEKKMLENSFEEALHSSYNIVTAHSHFTTVSVPENAIPRLIGKAGRHIEGLATLFGCDLWIDDEKKELVICSYDDLRRCIAERSFLEMLAKDCFSLSQAHAIKEKVSADMDTYFVQKGKEALHEVSLFGAFADPILCQLGKLSLRNSSGQNVLLHCIETAKMALVAGKQLNISSDLAAAIALLHDIGKGLDTSYGARHPERGYAFLKAHQIDERICNGVLMHHQHTGHTSFESMLIPYLDAFSAKGSAKRLIQQSAPFQSIIRKLESLSFVQAAWCIDMQTKLLFFIRINDKKICVESIISTLSSHNAQVPIEAQLSSSVSLTQSFQTLTILPTLVK